ncbi:IS607 family transposase [Candidatus Bathyarchaeota archaeon]|nr:IS607 family transposase [Candidatus Bathyarchaeota archaeon]MBS7627208.1 IS607 family transposase [Candidatus Bathyarchaeota archaeon]
MSLEKHYTMKEASRILGVSVRRLQIWNKEGKIKCIRTVGGRRRIPESELKRILGIKDADVSRKTAIYVRVSSHDQKQRGDLDRQKQGLLEYAKSKGYEVVAVLEDVASGLNENRKSLNKLFEMVEKREVGTIIIGFKDRLTRFGFEYLERYFASHGVRIEVVDGEEPKDAYQELLEDLLALVSSFAGKLYGLGSHKYEKVVESVKQLFAEWDL